MLDELSTARRFLDGTPAAVAVLDANLRHLYLNDTLARFNGLPVEEHLGRPMPQVLPGSGPSAEPAREVLRTGAPQTVVFDGRAPYDQAHPAGAARTPVTFRLLTGRGSPRPTP
ncbi:PAS domain-containing protein [Streptomyces canus]|uniref:PAS domain-containing protein n=1 Tax=Streptomyces canus TaxID=58343 RepID=UPI0033B86A51